MDMVLYNSIGKGYNHSRKPDQRIVQYLIDLLDLPIGSVLADIGAGTGNYSNAIAEKGYHTKSYCQNKLIIGERL